jgi:conjugative transfer region protein (TIGR03750 family)
VGVDGAFRTVDAHLPTGRILVGKVLLSLAAVACLVFVSMWLAGKRLKVIKRGKPKQYHMLAMAAWLQDRGLAKETLIRQSRVWDIKRWRTL